MSLLVRKWMVTLWIMSSLVICLPASMSHNIQWLLADHIFTHQGVTKPAAPLRKLWGCVVRCSTGDSIEWKGTVTLGASVLILCDQCHLIYNPLVCPWDWRMILPHTFATAVMIKRDVSSGMFNISFSVPVLFFLIPKSALPSQLPWGPSLSQAAS